MARFLTPALALALLAAVALPARPAGAQAPAADAAAPRMSLGATLKACSRSTSGGRYAIFVGTMPQAGGASRLQMRFDLQSRPDIGGLWKPVPDVVAFGEWEGTAPDVGGLKVTKQVFLNQGFAYRAVVRFRWQADSGKVVRRAQRVSAPCLQRDPRPDLTVTARAGSGGVVAVVRNAGHASGPFEVKVATGSRLLATEKVSSLGAGRVTPLLFDRLSCTAGSTLKVTVDAGSQVTERSEANNAAELRCPSSGYTRQPQ